MQFFLLLLTNVFIGAVLYLVISLKLEKSASEFREKKFRKEMDEVIREFNATAERNISILENRIALLKKLLKQSGDIKSLDIVIEENDIRSYETGSASASKGEKAAEKATMADFSENPGEETKIDDDKPAESSDLIKKSLILLSDKIKHINPFNRGGIAEEGSREHSAAEDRQHFDITVDDASAGGDFSGDQPVEIEKDLRDISVDSQPEMHVQKSVELNDDEIESMISASEDKYSLVSAFHEKGCGAEDIARYSGIPVGEVKLVLNLLNS